MIPRARDHWPSNFPGNRKYGIGRLIKDISNGAVDSR